MPDRHRRSTGVTANCIRGIHSARRGTYRVLYRINESQREVVVLRVDHRRDAYRPR
ncbi:type II toxin-antitoxin system RelE family toxin [Intrasporangium mesophilum]